MTNSFSQACANLPSSPYRSSCRFSGFRFTPQILCIAFIPELPFLMRFRAFPLFCRPASLLSLAALEPA